MSTFKNKHVFFIGDNDKFFALQADSLIKKANINASNLSVIVLRYSNKDNFDSLNKIKGISYTRYNENLIPSIAQAKTLTSMSLSSKNAWLLRKLLDFSPTLKEKLYIFITDDEVERWNNIYKKHGKLIASTTLVSNDDISVLKEIKYFIANKKTFEPIITKILQRQVSFIDCNIIFDILPTDEHKKLASVLLKIKPKKEKLKILYGSKKGLPKKSIFDFYTLCSKIISPNKELEFIIFSQPLRKKILIALIIFILKLIKNKKITIHHLHPVDSLTYMVIIMSCTHIILQARGGASTARTYAKLGRGALCIEDKTHNSYFFENAYNINILKYDSIEKLAHQISNEYSNAETNQHQLEVDELKSLQRFKELYN